MRDRIPERVDRVALNLEENAGICFAQVRAPYHIEALRPTVRTKAPGWPLCLRARSVVTACNGFFSACSYHLFLYVCDMKKLAIVVPEHQTNEPKKWRSLDQVADHYGISTLTVRRKIWSGEWKAVDIGRAKRMHDSEIERIDAELLATQQS